MSDTIMVKPHPKHEFASALRHPHSGPILGHDGKVPEEGKAWLYDGFTCRMLTDGAVVRADDPMFAPPRAADTPKPALALDALPRPFVDKGKSTLTDAPAV